MAQVLEIVQNHRYSLRLELLLPLYGPYRENAIGLISEGHLPSTLTGKDIQTSSLSHRNSFRLRFH
jgi:hypothetical protein